MSIWDSGSMCMDSVCWVEAERFYQPRNRLRWRVISATVWSPLTHYGLQEFRQQVPQVSWHCQDQAIRLEVCPRYSRFLGSCLARRRRDGSGMAVREKPKSPTVNLRQAVLCHPSVAPRPCSLAPALLPRPLERFLYFGVVGAWQREAGGSQLTY